MVVTHVLPLPKDHLISQVLELRYWDGSKGLLQSTSRYKYEGGNFFEPA